MDQETVQETIQRVLTSPVNSKILSVIGSCKTLGQLESCKHWIERIVDSPEDKSVLYMLANVHFGRIDYGIDI